jgi:hypothetical protein
LQRVITVNEDPMKYFQEQLSVADNRQLGAQIDLVREMTAQAFSTAEQVLALNISTSRASAERAASTLRQLFSITDPRDLLTLGSQTQEQLSAMYAYGRELLNIATDARMNMVRHNAGLPTPAPEQPAARQAAPAPAAPVADEPAAQQQTSPVAPPHLVAVPDSPASAEPPRAKAKPVAKAVGKATGKRAGAPHPSAAPIATGQAGDVALPRLDPAKVAPVLELKPRKSQRKK